METLFPLCFNDALTEGQLYEKECGDGVYVSPARFTTFMSDDDESMVTLSIKKGGLDISVHIIGTHTGDGEAVYAPSWICQLLSSDPGDFIELSRIYPVTGNTITIKPHTSSYEQLEDPAAELRNAFERYSCIHAGIDIPLLVAGEVLIVSVIDNGFGEPINIRGIELSVEIATPLDKEAELEAERIREEIAAAEAAEEVAREAKRAVEEAAVAAATAAAAAAKAALDKRFPGVGRRLCDGAPCTTNGPINPGPGH